MGYNYDNIHILPDKKLTIFNVFYAKNDKKTGLWHKINLWHTFSQFGDVKFITI
jgi:hypothetical protein